MCGECFVAKRRFSGVCATVSTHICAGNVSKIVGLLGVSYDVSTHICAGNVSGKFCPCKMLQYRFNSYMCGECFSWYVYDGVKWALFQLIYVRGMLQVQQSAPGVGAFQFIYVRGMFRCKPMGEKLSYKFQLIYARGMFRLQAMPWLPLELFQFIYVRGMFPSASGIGRWSTRWFQLIYVRGIFLATC